MIEQILLSLGGMVIMTAVAWLLDRAQKVPNLFVDAGLEAEPDAGTQLEAVPVTRTQPSAA